MRVSLLWLKQYVDIDLSVERIAELLTGCGLEVEGTETFETLKGGLEGVVIGEVTSCAKHPNADKLHLTTVDIGSGAGLQIVCGAPNVAAGQKVLVAKVGAKVYKGEESFQIRETKIRGELSQGMICAEDELGLGDSHSGIMVLPDNVEVGKKASEYFNVYTDVVFEIGLTPNRSDAFSHTGIARDLVALINTHHLSSKKETTLRLPDVSSFQPDEESCLIPVTVEDSIACPRYCGLTLSEIKIGPSPLWMQNFLKAAGLRPINNVVDITNFVLLETGQPLHAFDATKIQGNKVIVKKLPAGTRFVTLDGIERTLNGNDLMICNDREGMCMAGIYGGMNSGITEETTRLFLESAYFNPVNIRISSKYHGLKTDSSQRFERGANPDMTIYAMKRAALLLKEYAGARITSAIQDHYPNPVNEKKVSILFKNIDKIIGKSIHPDIIKEILINLEIKVDKITTSGMELSVPPFKVDVEREADIAEEILRIYGYNNVEFNDEIRYSQVISDRSGKETIRDFLSNQLCSLGFFEIMCNSLIREDFTGLLKKTPDDTYVRLLNPLSRDLEYMRRTLLFGGLETIVHNQNRKNNDIKIYEFGNVYAVNPQLLTTDSLEKYSEEEHFCLWMTGSIDQENWQGPLKVVDFYYVKSMINSMLQRCGIQGHQYEIGFARNEIFSQGLEYAVAHNETLLDFGEISPLLLKEFDIKTPVFFACIRWKQLLKLTADNKVKYSELPRFPWVRRDLALLLDNNISYDQIEKVAMESGISILKKMNLFDIYEGEKLPAGKKSYAVSFILQDEEKTLTDMEIEKVMNRLVKHFKESMGATLR